MYNVESGMNYTFIDGTPYYYSEPTNRYRLPQTMKRKTSLNTSNQCQEGTCALHVLSKMMCNFVRVILTPDLSPLDKSSLKDYDYSEDFEDCDDLYNITKCPNILECIQSAQDKGCSAENIFYALLYRIFYRILSTSTDIQNFQIIKTIIDYCKTLTPRPFLNFWYSPTEDIAAKSFQEITEELTLKLENEERKSQKDLASLELNLEKVMIQGIFVDEYRLFLDLVYISLENLKSFIERGELQLWTVNRPKMRQHSFITKMKKILNLNLYIYLSVGESIDERGHALTIVGFDETRDVLFIKNSWGRGKNHYKSLVTKDESGLGVISLRKFRDPVDSLIRSVHAIIPKETELSGTRKLKGFTK